MSTLKDKICFVTGCASGIGKATVKMMIAEGAKVFSLELNHDGIEALKTELKTNNFDAYCGSVCREDDVSAAFAACRAKFGPVEILMNNAGLGIPTPDLAETELTALDKMMDVNVKGVFLATREALKDMKPAGKGHVLTLISMAGQRTNPGAPLYCASKFAARGFNSGLLDQVVKLGIKVTDINPGPVDSKYWGSREVPREKFLKPVEVADVVRFILTLPGHMVVREINFDNIHWLAK